MEDVLRVRLKIKTAHLCCLFFIYKLRVFSKACFTQKARENVCKSSMNHWVFAGFSQADCAGTIRDSHAESLASLLEIDVPQLLLHLCLCSWVGRGEAPEKGGKE